jgi:uncharacterized protein YecE (DUF72 family)
VKLLAGTSGYAFKEWKGSFYPADLKDDGWLGYYASRFPSVEINNTFYRLPKESVLREWASQVPETFTFAIKASQRITHMARLKEEAASPLEYLLRTTSSLGSRLGPILFQLPPNLKKDLPRLRGFLAALPGAPAHAGDAPFVLLSRKSGEGFVPGETWIVRGWQDPMRQYFEGVGAKVNDVIDLDLEEGFVELLRSARPADRR